MRSKILLRWVLTFFVLASCVVLITVISSFAPEKIISDNSAKSIKNISVPVASEQVNHGLPIRLKIPQINVDATVISVGLTPTGAMAVPTGPSDVAWYKLGPLPGSIGSAVISGHYGWKNNIPAVFDNLSKLKKGDRISVEDDNGATVTFIVQEVRIYGENQDASDVFISNDGKAHLNLITCGGVWDKIRKSYSNRLVVFADKE